MEALCFTVPDMSCGHCATAVRVEIEKVPGVERVDVELATKVVVVTGTAVDPSAVRAAVDEAGYEAVA
jgi:copper chaperone